ncbi:hypothetical protein [Streptomyces johnsoniae]|uniref:Uncharacterized protein n=1 Tax=Streptomyces johnsoniae TaxID=3075532 RepID=A0ABU2S3B2_9ACTN|nr:hypothetical protein [Streptomyces sp. DSM 41886]MDT0442304.1 hypothetical protein [Streptomyces sp. DSM 41886]
MQFVRTRDVFENEVYLYGDEKRIVEAALPADDNPWLPVYAWCAATHLGSARRKWWTEPEPGGRPDFLLGHKQDSDPWSGRHVHDYRWNRWNRVRFRSIEKSLCRIWRREFKALP